MGAELLREELEYALKHEESDGEVAVVDIHKASAAGSMSEVFDDLRARPRADIVLVKGLGQLTRAHAARLDELRNALLSGPQLIFVITEDVGERVSRELPNFWAWIGARCFAYNPAEGAMDVAARLESLRVAHELEHAEVIRRAEAKTLPLTPTFVEWLILLERGDLLGD